MARVWVQVWVGDWIFGLWYVTFSEPRHQGFSLDSPVFSLPSLGNGFSLWKKTTINVISTLSNLKCWAVPFYHVAYDMLHVMNTPCVAHGLHTVALWPLECMCWRQFTVQWKDCKNIKLCLSMQLSSLSLLLLNHRSNWVWWFRRLHATVWYHLELQWQLFMITGLWEAEPCAVIQL